MKKLILSALFASALAVTGAYAQSTDTTTTTTTTEQGKKDKEKDKDKDKDKNRDKDQNKVKTTEETNKVKTTGEVKETRTTGAVKEEKTTTTTASAGTIEEFVPGESIVVRTEAPEPVHYRVSKQVVYVNGAGQVIEASAVRKSARVHYHFVQEGGEMIVDRIIVD